MSKRIVVHQKYTMDDGAFSRTILFIDNVLAMEERDDGTIIYLSMDLSLQVIETFDEINKLIIEAEKT